MHTLQLVCLMVAMMASPSFASRMGKLTTSRSGVQGSCATKDLRFDIAHTPAGLDVAMRSMDENAAGRVRATRDASNVEMARADAMFVSEAEPKRYAFNTLDSSRINSGKFQSLSGDTDYSLRHRGTILDIDLDRMKSIHAGRFGMHGGSESTAMGGLKTFTGDLDHSRRTSGSTVDLRGYKANIGHAFSPESGLEASSVGSRKFGMKTLSGDQDSTISLSGSAVKTHFSANKLDKSAKAELEKPEIQEAIIATPAANPYSELETGKSSLGEQLIQPRMAEQINILAIKPEMRKLSLEPVQRREAILERRQVVVGKRRVVRETYFRKPYWSPRRRFGTFRGRTFRSRRTFRGRF